MGNSAFSQQLPALQLAWDSTSSGELKRCPRRYQLSIVQGYRSAEDNVHLSFGIFLHSAREQYARERARGAGHDEALEIVCALLMTQTWDDVLQRPWQGSAKKNRFTLMKTIVFLLDKLEDDPLMTLHLSDGRPMVEMHFTFPLGLQSTSTKEDFLLCGHLDRVGEYGSGGPIWINDTKSTEKNLTEDSLRWFFSSFSPDNQMTLYAFAGTIVLPRRAEGILIDAVQAASGDLSPRHERAPVTRTQAQLDEWLRGFHALLREAEHYAEDDFWPMRETSCYGCSFRGICSLPPAERQAQLDKNFVKRVWNPLIARGD